MPSMHPPAAASSFRQWRHGDSLSTLLSRAQADVRARPTDAGARWLLFELLCVLGAWDRALKHLQTCAVLKPALGPTAQALRGLIRAERQRGEVFAGRQPPLPLAACAGWMQQLAQALQHDAVRDTEAADRLRGQALEAATTAAGSGNLGAFAWITDSDTRLGPVCELVAAGSYRWAAFHDLAHIAIEPPARLLDLVWIRARIVPRGGSPLHAYLPVRYPELPPAGDALLLARETVWRDVGRTGVFAQGQKTWTTDAGDWALLDVRTCDFSAPEGPATQAAGREAAP